MCGIAGFFNPRGIAEDRAGAVLGAMTTCIAHRGPDDHGVWWDAEAGIALGHRRLSILDLSPLGHQPMRSACGRYVLIFNGEIYNFKGLRAELEQAGHCFRGHSDTEVLLAAVSGWGVRDAIQRCNGMFAFALWDRKDRALHLVRDRAGEKPLFYGWMGANLLFGSELKALRAHPAFRGELDRDALALYLRHGFIPAPYSVYREIRKLPPATLLTVCAGSGPDSAAPVPYWSLRAAAERGAADPFAGTPEEAVTQLDILLRDAVGLRMEADVPLGAFLSGGIDSSTVVALMQAQSARPVKTFSIGFREAAYNEAHHAAAVARHLGTDHTELYVTPQEAMAVVPRLPTLYDEPFADSSQIPTFLVSEMTRRHVTVSLSGDGGDELFGGYDRYRLFRGVWGKIGWLPGGVRRGTGRALTAVVSRLSAVGGSGSFSRRASEKAHLIADVLADRDAQALYRRILSHWKDPSAVVRGGTEPPTVLTDSAAWMGLPNFTHRMMYADAVMYLPDDILVKVDRASMGVSLEARVPLLDHRVIEFAWRLPLGLKIRDGQEKWILRQVLRRYVPRELIDRPKMGFGVPIDVWLRSPLRDWAEELLDERRLRAEGIFEPGPIRRKWREHLTGVFAWHHYLWDVLVFQAWLEAARSGEDSRHACSGTERSDLEQSDLEQYRPDRAAPIPNHTRV